MNADGESRNPLICRMLARIPQRLRFAVIGGALFAAALSLYLAFIGGTASLTVICRHDLRRAAISIWVDGKLVQADVNAGSARKRFGIFGKSEASFSRTLEVASGEHTVQVRLRSASDGYDQTRQNRVKVVGGRESTLTINAERGSEMEMSYLAPSVPATGAGFSGYALSILTTVCGTVLSASVGFFVQEFLRSKKTRRASPIATPVTAENAAPR